MIPFSLFDVEAGLYSTLRKEAGPVPPDAG